MAAVSPPRDWSWHPRRNARRWRRPGGAFRAVPAHPERIHADLAGRRVVSGLLVRRTLAAALISRKFARALSCSAPCLFASARWFRS